MPANRVFTQKDQEDFAVLSGDRNPMHVDPLRARRFILGETVVHGVNALLWGLESACAERRPLEILALDARFLHPMAVGQNVHATWSWQDDELELELDCNQTATLFARISFAPLSSADAEVLPDLPPAGECSPLGPKDLERGVRERMALHLDREMSRRLFPGLTRLLPPAQLAALLLTSRIIGMRCPGLHSVFAGLKLSAHGETTSATGFELTNFDERFSFATLAVTTPALAGTLTAFLRPEPARQPPYGVMREMVEEGEFAQARALVIGGSRGLGEVAAKLLAAGGAEIRLTYLRGSGDAASLVREIKAGGGRCSHHPLDVLAPSTDLSAILDGWRPTDLLYFASPPIFAGRKHAFSKELYDRFTHFYIHGFMAVLASIGMEGPLRVLYPSSVAVEELPDAMLEYSGVKAAGENLCANLFRQFPGLEMTVPRLPRLNTDQTASFYPVENKEPAPIILNVLRKMHSAKG